MNATLTEHKQAALSAVEAVETLTRGEPWSPLVTLAIAAITALRDAAMDVVFPRALMPTTPAALAAYTHLTGRLGPVGFGDRCAELHERALLGDEALSALFRSPECLEDVGAAAAMRAHPSSHLEAHATAEARATAAARAAYALAIARALVAHEHELAPAAAVIIDAADLKARLDRATAEHETHAALELVRQREEHAAAAREARDKTIQRVREAEARRADARARAEQTEREYRETRAAAFIERMKLSGLERLRLGRGEGGVYDVAALIRTAPLMSLEQINRYEAALTEHEASA